MLLCAMRELKSRLLMIEVVAAHDGVLSTRERASQSLAVARWMTLPAEVSQATGID